MKVKDWLNACNRTSIYLEVWDTDDTIDIPHFVGYSSELQNSPKYRRVLNANLDFWDFDYESADAPVNYYFKLIVSGLKNESTSRKSSRKLGIRESYNDSIIHIYYGQDNAMNYVFVRDFSRDDDNDTMIIDWDLSDKEIRDIVRRIKNGTYDFDSNGDTWEPWDDVIKSMNSYYSVD